MDRAIAWIRKRRRALGLVAATAAFLWPFFVELDDLSEAGHRLLAVFGLAVVLWVTEAIPLHATAALIIFGEILLVSDQALVGLPVDYAEPSFATFFGALAHPVLMLFLGGFFLAAGASRYELDRTLARVLLRPFGTSPRAILLGVMVITAVSSMFMSNTATTATLLAVMLPVIASLPPDDRLRAALALSIPVAANLGGMGTPVGTPPNAIAVGSLTDAGITFSFVQWIAMALPFVAVLLVVAWIALSRLFPASVERLVVDVGGRFDRSRSAVLFYVVFAVTVIGWLTEPLHGVTSSVVGFLPVVVLLATGVMTAKDLQRMQWHVLWLVAGGIALGLGVGATGLDLWLIGLVDWSSITSVMLTFALTGTALLLSTVISNTAAANLLVPIGLTLVTSGAVDTAPRAAAFFIAVGASLAMMLPVSNAPNAIAYATGAITTRRMATIGAIVGVTGLLLVVGVGPTLWDLMGLDVG